MGVLLLVFSLILQRFSYSLKINSPSINHCYVYNRCNTLKLSNDNNIETSDSLKFPSWLPSFGTAALGGLLFGSDIGSSSSVVRILGSGESIFGSLNAFQLGELASSSLLGAMLSSIAIIQIGDLKIGRKTELLIASVLFILGTLIQSTAGSFELELVGRSIFGLGIGTAMHVAPLYIAETSPSNIRGKLISFKEAAIVLGIVLGYAAGALFGASSNWNLVYFSALPFELLMFAGALAVMESPRWLALRGRQSEAIDSLMQIQDLSRQESSDLVAQMVPSTVNSDTKSQSNIVSFLTEVKNNQSYKQALTIGIGLVLFQQLSGQPSVLYFANRIFERAGLGYEAALGVGIFKLAMTLTSAQLVEDPKFGRKPLLLYGSLIMTVSLLAITTLFALFNPSDPSIQIAIIGFILLYVGGYQVGYGPISWLILSEIFPLAVRSSAVSLGTLSNFGSNLLVTLLFEAERVQFGESVLFLQFTIISIIATLFINKVVFETRGLSLEEIEAKLKNIVDQR